MTAEASMDMLQRRERNQRWLADHLGISQAHMTLLLQGKRQWTDDLKRQVADILQAPAWLLFPENDNVKAACK